MKNDWNLIKAKQSDFGSLRFDVIYMTNKKSEKKTTTTRKWKIWTKTIGKAEEEEEEEE